MKNKFGLYAAFAAGAIAASTQMLASTETVYAADMDAMVTKAPMMAPAAATPAACGSVYDFFLTS
jgi:hypothetical protein